MNEHTINAIKELIELPYIFCTVGLECDYVRDTINSAISTLASNGAVNFVTANDLMIYNNECYENW